MSNKTYMSFAEIQKKMQIEKKNKNGVKFSFRNAEDIYTKFKEINDVWELTIDDEFIGCFNGRILLKTIARLNLDGERERTASVIGELSEVWVFKQTDKQGNVIKETPQMSPPQWAGAVSSYGAKYAMGRLFGIGEKDLDEYDLTSDDNAQITHAKKASQNNNEKKLSEEERIEAVKASIVKLTNVLIETYGGTPEQIKGYIEKTTGKLAKEVDHDTKLNIIKKLVAMYEAKGKR